MKYKTTKAFITAVQTGKFAGIVIVDNDSVEACQDGDAVCDFERRHPEEVLIDVLEALGVSAERP